MSRGARSLPALALIAVLAIGALAAPLPAGVADAADAADAADRPDPDSDVLGWEDGYWHDEAIDVDASDGLDDGELEAVVARSMARVEEVRGLEFDRRVPVEILTRPEFREEARDRYDNVTAEQRLHQNVKFEALFMVGESTDAVALQRSNLAGGVLGYYDPAEDRIVVVSEDTESPELDEITLAQELFHALQYQHFEMGYDRSTLEGTNAVNGIVEGDGNYVDYLYEQRCGEEWDCLLPDRSPGSGGAGYEHIGLALLQLVPYSDGPPFVEDIREEGGWDAVDAVYADPPASTEQLIHPEKYGTDAPTELEVADRSGDGWSVLDLEGSVDHAIFGEGGMFTMLWYQGFRSRSNAVVPLDIAARDPPDVYNYSHRYTAGWDGDRLVPYVRADSGRTNETGYVWKTAWDSPAEAREFGTGYRALLDHHDARRVGTDTYVIDAEGGSAAFADAFHLNRSGERLTIVNAPTVEALSGVADVAVDRTFRTTAPPTDPTAGTDAPGVPGFTLAAALVATLLVAFALARGP
jgi:hypothetical protein